MGRQLRKENQILFSPSPVQLAAIGRGCLAAVVLFSVAISAFANECKEVGRTSLGGGKTLVFREKNAYPSRIGRIVEQQETKQAGKERTLSGVVIDENGEAMPGVSVVIKGTKGGVMTDINGKFSIKVSSSLASPRLLFTFIGMQAKEVSIKSGVDTYKVILEEKAGQQILSVAAVLFHVNQKS